MTTEPYAGQADAGTQSGIRDELMQDAGRIKDKVGARAKQEAETRKGEAVQVAGSASAALQSAAENLQDNPDAPDWMATALQQAARQIDRLAGHVDGRGIDDLGHEVAQFARSNPGAFLAASAAAGFAAARVLRAGADKQRHDHPGGDTDQHTQYGSYDTQSGHAAGGPAAGFGGLERSIGNDIAGVTP